MPDLPNSFDMPMNAQDCQQDMLRRMHKWLTVLEERIVLLLHVHEAETLKPGECEQAISRHLVLLLRLLQLRQQHAETRNTASEQALLEALLHGSDDL